MTFTNTAATISKINIGTSENQSGTFVIECGDLTTASGVQMGSAIHSEGTLIQNGGEFKSKNSITMGNYTGGRVGRYYMNGGTLTITKNGIAAGNQGKGYFYMYGGTVTAKTLSIMGKNPGTGTSEGQFVLRGGSAAFDTRIDLGNATGPSKSSIVLDPLLRIVGSEGSLSTKGDFTIYTPNEYMRTKFRVEIDDGGISPVEGTGAASVAGLNGTLEAGVAGGIAVTSANTFDVLSGFVGITNEFATLPDSALWDTAGVVQDTETGLSSFRVALADAASKGSFAATESLCGKVSFEPVSKGYVTLTDLPVGETIPVRLAVDLGETALSDFVAALNESGRNASVCDDDKVCNVMFPYTAEASTGYVVWDLTGIAPGATVSNVSAGEKPGNTLFFVL